MDFDNAMDRWMYLILKNLKTENMNDETKFLES